MGPDHAHEMRRLAHALRQYDNARAWRDSQNYGPNHEGAGLAYRVAIIELAAAALRAVQTAEPEGEFTSPLMGGSHADP